MYCASFIWKPGIYDSEFHELNAVIDKIAQLSPGFLGAESWQSADGTRKCANYFWEDLGALKAFSGHPAHLKAKRQYTRWYDGYHVIVSEIIRSYGDGSFEHITPDDHRRVAA